MRKLTITLDDEVARWARVRAAEHGTSVSRLLGDVLRQRMAEESGYDEAMNRFLAARPQDISGGAPYPTRDQVHDRRRLRTGDAKRIIRRLRPLCGVLKRDDDDWPYR